MSKIIFNRTITSEIARLAQKYPVISLTGPRQSGKTTCLKYLFKDSIYISLEDPDIRQFATQDPRGFLNDAIIQSNLNQKKPKCIILDEVQRVPEIFSYIQSIVDNNNIAGQFILSGSQNFLLHEKITQSLAGRVAIFTLLPLSIAELISSNIISDPGNISILNKLIYNGCYPRIYKQDLNPADLYPDYINTYIERDVRSVKNITDISAFQTFLKICAGHCGQLINLTTIGNNCGISHNTAKAWLSLLEASYIVFKLQPYYKNFSKRLVKTPKLYFYDTGLVCSLLGIQNEQQLTSHYLKGGIFESFIVSEIKKIFFNQHQQPNLYFWQDKNKTEVDCIIEHGQDLTAIEIKSGQTISKDYFKGLNNWQKLLKQDNINNSTKNLVVYAGDLIQNRSDATVIPWYKISEYINL